MFWIILSFHILSPPGARAPPYPWLISLWLSIMSALKAIKVTIWLIHVLDQVVSSVRDKSRHIEEIIDISLRSLVSEWTMGQWVIGHESDGWPKIGHESRLSDPWPICNFSIFSNFNNIISIYISQEIMLCWENMFVNSLVAIKSSISSQRSI